MSDTATNSNQTAAPVVQGVVICPICNHEVGNDTGLLVKNIDGTLTASIHCCQCDSVLTAKLNITDFR